jgi:hypothetical protein
MWSVNASFLSLSELLKSSSIPVPVTGAHTTAFTMIPPAAADKQQPGANGRGVPKASQRPAVRRQLNQRRDTTIIRDPIPNPSVANDQNEPPSMLPQPQVKHHHHGHHQNNQQQMQMQAGQDSSSSRGDAATSNLRMPAPTRLPGPVTIGKPGAPLHHNHGPKSTGTMAQRRAAAKQEEAGINRA